MPIDLDRDCAMRALKLGWSTKGMFDLSKFSLRHMTECGAAIRQSTAAASNMEDAASSIIRYLRKSLVDSEGKPASALIRLYKTHPYGDLPPPLQKFAAGVFGEAQDLRPTTKCLTLMATAGDLADWNSRQSSTGHKAIPLPSAQVVGQLPMVAQLVRQLGIEVTALLDADTSLLIDAEQRTYNVFYIAEAEGSPFIPAQQQFVIPHGVRSVLGFGGLFHTGDLFAVIVFSKLAINRNTADLFKTLALNVKMAMLPFAAGPVFGESARE
jgi:hypothetical protein